MVFFLRRVLAALNRRKGWLPLILVLPLLYLVWASLTQNEFNVEQTFSYTGDVPIAAADNPVEQFPLAQVASQPDDFFLDRFAVSQLSRRLALSPVEHGVTDDISLSRLLLSTMSLDLDPAQGTLRIQYQGDNEALGRIFVDYFSERLQTRAKVGRERLARQRPAAAESQDLSSNVAVGELTANGATVSSATRSLWSTERLTPTLALLLLSLVLFLLVVTALEMLDPSFKSERQVARYLGVPILGSLPDAGALVKRLPKAEAKEIHVAADNSR